MCGIAGYLGNVPLEEARISSTLVLMKQRGPDHHAAATFQDKDNHIALLHSRLSIIDLDPRSNQPFSLGDCTMVFNGEIYNYLELRRTLVAQGRALRTESDTEVLLWYYLLHGEQCVKYFEGMWAFAIYNRKRSTLFLSRDRFGEKPLYYFKTDNGLFFGSETRFLKSLSGQSFTVNRNHILRYLVNGFRALYKSNETFYQDVHEVPYATNIVIGANQRTSTTRYWHPRSIVQEDMSRTDAVREFKSRFLESIKLRLRSDVPLAFCLSGGVDSSAIASVAAKELGAKVTTFSIVDSDPRYHERPNIQATIDDLGCENTIIELSRDNFFERMKKLVAYHDAPVATISYYVHALLCEAIAAKGYKVALSGTGADELLAGYYDHFILHLHEVRQRLDYEEYLKAWEKHIEPLTRNPYLKNSELYKNDSGARAHLYLDKEAFSACLKVQFHEEFAEQDFCKSLLRKRMMNEMFHEIVPVILHEDDLNSMMFSIENRSPFLDSKLLEFCYSIPAEHLIVDGYGKYILREAVKGILNERVRCDRQKIGFNASINSLVDFKDAKTRQYLLADSPIFELVARERIIPHFDKNPMSDSLNKFMFSFISAKMFLEGL